MLNIKKIREDFPILSEKIGSNKVIYLDNAASTQVPEPVIQAMVYHYRHEHANVHRGIHTLSERSTSAFEHARDAAADFFHVKKEEIIFTHGTTESINMAAFGLRSILKKGDCVAVTELEHNSNFLPWQRLCKETGAEFIILPCPDGELDRTAFLEAMEKRLKIVAVTQTSNLTGTVMPLEELIIPAAHKAGALVLVDGAQGARHGEQNLKQMDCDFYCCSGHKIMGPTGIGILYGKTGCLEMLDPMLAGGGMVGEVGREESTWGPLPSRLEAGTPDYAGAVGLGKALEYLQETGLPEIAAYEDDLIRYAEEKLSTLPGLTILGHPKRRQGVLSFTLEGLHPFDVASVIDKMGVAVRSGTHCAHIGLSSFHLDSAIRLSVAFYNTFEEIDNTCRALEKAAALIRSWIR